MKQNNIEHLAEATMTLTKGAGVGTSVWGVMETWNFINTNAAGIGVILTFLFGIIAVCLNIYNARQVRASQGSKEDLDSYINETKKKLHSLNQGVKKIIDKLPE